jgi:ornithine cyclodeaminase/alanine dehydrogenase-like protein (mu-crystallin family)
VFDLDREKAERLAGDQTDGPSRRVVHRPEDAVRDCDVVVPVTMAPSPFIPAAWLAPGTVAISVSSLDFDVDTVREADLLVADDVEHETAHAARLFARADAAGLLNRDAVVPLGAIVVGAHPGRASDEDLVVVSPIGLGIEDVAWATYVFRQAEKLGLGTEQKLWDEPVWT